MGFVEDWLAYKRKNPNPEPRKIQELLDDWLFRYPPGRLSRLEMQIQNPEKELDAISELWVYDTLGKLGLQVDVNPAVEVKKGADCCTPDFRISDGNYHCYSDVTALHPEPPGRTRKL